MRRSFYSHSWHNVADLRPRLLPHARISRHVYRGEPWFVVQDTTAGRYHRISPGAYVLLTRMDGTHTVQSLWDEALQQGGDQLPTQDEVVELLMQLYTQDLLHCDVTPDAAELFERYRKRRNMKWKQWLLNPLSLRIPLIDPDAFLTRWAERLAWIFSRRGALLWLVVVIPAVALAAQHWRELTENLSDRMLATSNLLALALIYPIVKALHELGHGFATKVWGGAVHEMGLMFLVFAPVPYVDASASSTFPSKHQRAVVGAAGILVETFIGALAMYAWVLVEPGVVRSLLFNVMLIAGVSTVIVNGNPLLRFDGYFVFSDLIEMPNLAQRGQRYLRYLSDRYLFGAKSIEPPHETAEAKRWLFFYTISAWVYRIIITVSIIIFIAGEFFIFGVLLALWGATTLVMMPVWKSIKHILSSPTLQRNRPHAIKVAIGCTAGLLIFVTLIPLPLRTQAEGVVWLPDQALVRAGANGFFERWLVTPGTYVKSGTPVALMRDPQLAAELAAAEARVAEAAARYRAQQFVDPVQGDILLQQLEHEQHSFKRVQERYNRLTLRSETDGLLTAPRDQDINEQFFKKGELLAYILDRHQLIARTVVTQDDIDLVRTRFKAAEIRFADAISESHAAKVIREMPGGINELPTAALSPNGGGKIATDPKDQNGLKTLDRIFLLDLNLPADTPPSVFGERVYVRFDHRAEPLASQWYRRLRQLFLSRFNV
jgi:putative peptide zinc metalloprotease protein